MHQLIRATIRTAPAAVLLGATLAHAHTTEQGVGATEVETWLVAVLVASAALYARGVARLWRSSVRGAGIGFGAVACFASGWSALVVALVSPLDVLAASGFRFHMIQHELLMVAAAPLMVLGRPLGAWAWALPEDALARLGAIFRGRAFGAGWRLLTQPFGAWTLHAAALWVWHAPPLFDAALARRGVHEWQHVCFLATALLFWWSVLGRCRTRPGIALASLFTTMLSTGALGALLTFSSVVLYAAYRVPGGTTLSPLEDQQIGGLIMWVPGGLVYVGAALGVAAAALRTPVPRHAAVAGAAAYQSTARK